MDKRIAIFMTDEQYENYKQSEDVIKRLIDQLQEEKASKRHRLRFAFSFSKKPDLNQNFQFEVNSPNLDFKKAITECVVKNPILLDALAKQIQDQYAENDRLKKQINNLQNRSFWQKLGSLLK